MSEETAVAPTVPFLAKAKFLGIGALVGLLLGGIGAGKVWMDMSGAVSGAAAAATQQVDAMQQKVTTATASLDGMKGQNRLLKARVAASEALYEFNRANYGSAADQLKMVRTHLEAIDAAAHGLDPAALDSARKAAKSTNIEVAGDLNAQSELLREMATRLDALVK